MFPPHYQKVNSASCPEFSTPKQEGDTTSITRTAFREPSKHRFFPVSAGTFCFLCDEIAISFRRARIISRPFVEISTMS